MPAPILCRPRTLPPAQLENARRRAVEINPGNVTQHLRVARTPNGRRGGPRRIAILIGRRWPTSGVRLTVKFLDNPPADLRRRILSHMNAWNKTANVTFTETRGDAKVRISRLDAPEDMAGYWSWLGTEILEIPRNEPTLNLEGFTMKTPDSEFRRVVRHEAGHTLGFEHEHMRADLVRRIDRKKAYAFFDLDQGWTREEVDQQVLTPLREKSLMGTAESDPTSIMCYHIPASIMKNGRAIRGGNDINKKDYAFAGAMYPKKVSAPKSGKRK